MSNQETTPELIPIIDSRLREGEFNAGMATTHATLEDAVEGGDVYDVSKFPQSGLIVENYDSDPQSTAVLRVMQRAIELHGAAVAEKFSVDKSKLIIGRNQLAAATRSRYSNKEERELLLRLSPIELQKLEDIEEPMPIIPTFGNGDTGDIESGDIGMSLGRYATDLQDSEQNTFLSSQIDHATFMIAARALAEMKVAAKSEYDRELAADALDQLEKLPDAAKEVQKVVHPETLKRVKLASVLGPKVVEVVTHAFVRQHLTAA